MRLLSEQFKTLLGGYFAAAQLELLQTLRLKPTLTLQAQRAADQQLKTLKEGLRALTAVSKKSGFLRLTLNCSQSFASIVTRLIEAAVAHAVRAREAELEQLRQAAAGIAAGREALKFAAQLKAASTDAADAATEETEALRAAAFEQNVAEKSSLC